MVPRVAFDEAGNTGQNLLDPNQPVFVTAGVFLSDVEIDDMRAHLGWAEDEELHFKVLKRSRKGIAMILRVFESPIITDASVKAFAIHKPFMVTTKIIDMLMEELAHRHGLDLYRDGGAHATANLFHAVGPAFCGPERYREMLLGFVTMVRTGRPSAIRRFYDGLRDMYAVCEDGTFAAGIATLIATEEIIGDVLSGRGLTDLDPAIPAFIQVAGAWDAQLRREWHVVHDESKPIAYEQDRIECFFDHPDEPRQGVGRGNHYVELPLRATKLELRPSHEVAQIQIADVLASATAYVLRGVSDPSFRDELWDELAVSPLMELSIGRVWPSTEMDPAELGRTGDDGSMVKLSGELIARGMERRYGPGWKDERRRRK